ncbi:MAG: helix-turn-helix domain-containing protein [Streptomycetales bacterium]
MGRAKGPLRVPAWIWRLDAMRHALQDRDIGAVFQVLKDHLGASQTQIGIAVVMSQGYVSDLMRGNARVTELEVYERIADGLAMPSDARVRLGLAPVMDGSHEDRDARAPVLAEPGTETSGPAMWTPARTVEDITRLTLTDLMLDRREANRRIGALLVGAGLTEPLEHWITRDPDSASSRPTRGTISDEEMRHIETVTHALRHWDNRFRMGIRRKAVVGQMNEVADLLNQQQPADITGCLFVVLAELAKIVGSMSYDAGLHPIAQRYYRLSLRASHASGEPGRLFGANILAAMARQMLDLDQPGDALDLVRLALDDVGPNAPGRVRSMLRTREGWAYAKTGRVQAFHRAVGLAEEDFHDSSGRVPYWVAEFDASELAGVVGARYRDLALSRAEQGLAPDDLARRAVDHISTALRLRAPRRLRNRAFDLVGVGRAYLLLGECEQAARVVRSAVEIEDTIKSGRVERRLYDFHTEAARLGDASPLVDLRAELTERFSKRPLNTLKETA